MGLWTVVPNKALSGSLTLSLSYFVGGPGGGEHAFSDPNFIAKRI
jgi:hypothetical protein